MVNVSCFATTASQLQQASGLALVLPPLTSSQPSTAIVLPQQQPGDAISAFQPPPPVPLSPPPSSSGKGGLPVSAVAAIAVSAVVIASVPFAALLYFAMKRRREATNSKHIGGISRGEGPPQPPLDPVPLASAVPIMAEGRGFQPQRPQHGRASSGSVDDGGAEVFRPTPPSKATSRPQNLHHGPHSHQQRAMSPAAMGTNSSWMLSSDMSFNNSGANGPPSGPSAGNCPPLGLTPGGSQPRLDPAPDRFGNTSTATAVSGARGPVPAGAVHGGGRGHRIPQTSGESGGGSGGSGGGGGLMPSLSGILTGSSTPGSSAVGRGAQRPDQQSHQQPHASSGVRIFDNPSFSPTAH